MPREVGEDLGGAGGKRKEYDQNILHEILKNIKHKKYKRKKTL